jgi:hypothetical protein
MARPLGGSRASAASKVVRRQAAANGLSRPFRSTRIAASTLAGLETGEQAIHGWTDPRQIGGEHHNRWRARVHDAGRQGRDWTPARR